MSRSVFLAAAFAVSFFASAAQAAPEEPLRLDATTVESAEDSFQRMAAELPKEKRHQLFSAMLMLNLKNAKSAQDVVNNPELQSPSIGTVKDEVAGMTADEIIAHANETSGVTVTIEEG